MLDKDKLHRYIYDRRKAPPDLWFSTKTGHSCDQSQIAQALVNTSKMQDDADTSSISHDDLGDISQCQDRMNVYCAHRVATGKLSH